MGVIRKDLIMQVFICIEGQKLELLKMNRDRLYFFSFFFKVVGNSIGFQGYLQGLNGRRRLGYVDFNLSIENIILIVIVCYCFFGSRL